MAAIDLLEDIRLSADAFLRQRRNGHADRNSRLRPTPIPHKGKGTSLLEPADAPDWDGVSMDRDPVQVAEVQRESVTDATVTSESLIAHACLTMTQGLSIGSSNEFKSVTCPL